MTIQLSEKKPTKAQLQEIEDNFPPVEHLEERFAEMTVLYRKDPTTKLTGVIDAVAFLRKIWDKDRLPIQEMFYLLCLNNRNEVLGWRIIGIGSVNYVPVDLRAVLAFVCCTNASSVIIAHNHPSGTLYPSKADKNLTEKLGYLLNLIEVNITDHIILTQESFTSFISDDRTKNFISQFNRETYATKHG